jgi:hypothetical protein
MHWEHQEKKSELLFIEGEKSLLFLGIAQKGWTKREWEYTERKGDGNIQKKNIFKIIKNILFVSLQSRLSLIV